MNYEIKLFTDNTEKTISNSPMFFCFTAALCHKLAICNLKLNVFQIYTLKLQQEWARFCFLNKLCSQ